MTTPRTLYGSLARIADLDSKPWDVEPRDKSGWATGDYVLGEVVGTPSELYHLEDITGDMIPVEPGDRIVGAFGYRAATLEGVGSWRDVKNGRMHSLTSAGLFGAFTSLSSFLPKPLALEYRGHLLRGGSKLTMDEFAKKNGDRRFDVPTILLVGTSMSAGKTTTGRLACRLLSEMNFKVVAAKLTGAGRYRDIKSFAEAGAAEIYDFVDVGMPSTVCPEPEFRKRIRPLLSHIATREADFLVAEAGASPLEPYNGAAAIEELGDNLAATILCASDPYAVVGVIQAFGLTPDLVTGPATNTTAAIDLVTALTGVPGINIADPASVETFREFLLNKLTANGADRPRP